MQKIIFVKMFINQSQKPLSLTRNIITPNFLRKNFSQNAFSKPETFLETKPVKKNELFQRKKPKKSDTVPKKPNRCPFYFFYVAMFTKKR